MKKTVSLLLILALLACLPPAWAAGPAGSVTVRFYDEESDFSGNFADQE